MSEQQPVVRRAFKYGKRFYKPGEIFEPEGLPNDAMILHSTLIAYMSDDDKRRKKGKQHETNHAARTHQQRLSKNHAQQHSNGTQ